MSNCQRCQSDRVLGLLSHSRDLNCLEFKGQEHQGYLPPVNNICAGDDVEIDICLECGQIQGTFPVEYPEFK